MKRTLSRFMWLVVLAFIFLSSEYVFVPGTDGRIEYAARQPHRFKHFFSGDAVAIQSTSDDVLLAGTDPEKATEVLAQEAVGGLSEVGRETANFLLSSCNEATIHKESTRKIVQRIDDVDIYTLEEDQSVLFFKSGMQIDADGAYKAYHKNLSLGLDYLENAGEKGGWWGVVTVSGKSGGVPVVQDSDDPAPGYYVSGTSLQDNTKEDDDPRRYVNSAVIPFIALPSTINSSVKIGDFGFVINTQNNKSSGCIFADVGPGGKIGEGSIALAKAVGISSDPKGEGTESEFIYVLFSNSSMGWPLTVDFINTHSKELFEQWGGMKRLKEVMP